MAIRNERVRALNEEERERRRRAREDEAAAVDRRRGEAKASGEPLVLTFPAPAAPDDPQAWFVDGDGRDVRTWPGVVELVNAPGRVYDYRVTIELEGGTEVDDGQVVQVGRPRVVVGAVETIRRPGGEPVGVRAMHSEGIGELCRLAVKHLTRYSDGSPVPMAEAGAKTIQRAGRPTTSAHDVAAAAFENRPSGEGLHAWIGRALREAGHGQGSTSYIHRLLTELRERGRIDYRPQRGRPSRG